MVLVIFFAPSDPLFPLIHVALCPDICGWYQHISFALWLLAEFSQGGTVKRLNVGKREIRVCISPNACQRRLDWSSQCPQTEQTAALTQGFGAERNWGVGGLSDAPVGSFICSVMLLGKTVYWLVASQRHVYWSVSVWVWLTFRMRAGQYLACKIMFTKVSFSWSFKLV